MEHLNRCRAVTDKGKDAWHKRTIGLAGVSQESVCRELSRVALAAEMGLEYRLGVNRLRAGVPHSHGRVLEPKLAGRIDLVTDPVPDGTDHPRD